MDSPVSASRGRGRASARKRQAHTTGPASQPDFPNPGAATTVESVEQAPPETSSASVVFPPFSFGTPSPSASRGTRARARAAEGTMAPSDDLDTKGGRSLRKRARVDYTTFDNADEDTLSDSNKTTPPTARAVKRRRTDTYSDGEMNVTHIKRRSSEQLPPPSSSFRRRSQARKSTAEPSTNVSDRNAEDVEVQDTIEVGGHHSSQSDESTLRRTSSNTSCGSSHNDSKPSQLTTSFDSVPQKKFTKEYTEQQPESDRIAPTRASDNLTNAPLPLPFQHLTPYVPGVFIDYPSVQPEADVASQQLQQDVEELADEQLDGAQLDNSRVDILQEDTPMVDVAGASEETPAASPLPLDTTANSPAAEAEVPYIQPPSMRPISFKQTRDAIEFTSLFDDYKSLPAGEIYTRLEVVNRALEAWQNEYNELRKLTDDENNAVRYRQEEVSFQHRYKMAVSKDPEANPLRKDFVVRGIRAPRPDPEVDYARHQDKLMAASWGFEYDDNVNKIGCQDPLAQRIGIGKGRLRERPKQTAKAAEADDGVIVHGKRQRKPPAVYDGSEGASRASTPAAPQRRRRRTEHTAAEDSNDVNLAVPSSAASSFEQATPKRKGKGGRPRKYPLPAPIAEDPPTSPLAEEVQPPSEQPKEENATRKRRRGNPVLEAAKSAEAVKEETPATNGIERQAPAKGATRRTNNNSRMTEVPSGSFYTSSMQSANAEDEARPATSSSTATEFTVTPNNYQLREKRQRKFSLNPTDVGDEEPNPKRVKRSKKTQNEDTSAAPLPASSTAPPSARQPVVEPHAGSKPPTKIKLKNYHGPPPGPVPKSVPGPNPLPAPSSSTPTPPFSGNGTSNGAANGTESADAKDYNQMTKSEKMSHSMKARWASGSMTGAVEKRRATLANKKQAVKAAEPNNQPLEAIPAAAAQH